MVVAAVIAACGAVAAAVVGLLNRKKLVDIHLLVNSRLDQALSQIEDLKQQRDRTQSKEDGVSNG